MGFYVHIHVSFACDNNDEIAALAKEYLSGAKKLTEEDSPDAHFTARKFLESLASRSGNNEGPKGGLSLWGMVGNYTRVDLFCELLVPFWKDLFKCSEGPGPWEHIIVFEESEQSEQAIAYEIFLEDEGYGNGGLITRRHELPFCWNQG